MKIVCNAKELAESLSVAGSIVPRNPSKPILTNFALIAYRNQLQILATDLEVNLRLCFTRLNIEKDGEILVDANRLIQILKELDDEVTIQKDGDGCLIRSKGCKFTIGTSDFDKFPQIEPFDRDQSFALPSEIFIDMVNKTHYAAAIEKTRYAMNGIFFKIEDENLILVATDGKRLSFIERRLNQRAPQNVEAVVPTKGLSVITKLLDASEDDIFIYFRDNSIFIQTEFADISARLVEGKFPPYEAVIPSNFTKTINLRKDDFSSAIRKAKLLTSRESESVKFKFANDELELSSRIADVGEASVKMDLDRYDYEELEIGFNPNFFLDVLKVIDIPDIVLRMNESTDAVMIEDDFKYIVMPIAL